MRQPVTRVQELTNSDRAMFVVRLVGSAFAALQVTVTPNQPSWVPPLGYLWAGALLGCAVLLRSLAVMAGDRRRMLVRLAWLGLGVDIAVMMAYVFLYTYDPTSALWALLFIVPLEGTIRFGLTGALGSMSAVSVLYVLRELWGRSAYGYPFLIDSVTYRLGIGFIIALVAGLMARSLRREREQALGAYARLQELDHLKDEFLTAASHELRTPLTVISGFVTTLRRYPDLPQDRRNEYLDAVLRHSERLTRLANDIIDVTRLERGRLPLQTEPMSVRDVAARTVEVAGVHAEIEVERCLIAWADPARVEQILFNLLHNATKYGRPPFAISATSVGDHIEIAVSDRGDGIPGSERDRIFELFYRTPGQTQPGSGIGLTFCRRLAEAQGGTLRYEPNDPAGARFVLSVPARLTPSDRLTVAAV